MKDTQCHSGIDLVLEMFHACIGDVAFFLADMQLNLTRHSVRPTGHTCDSKSDLLPTMKITCNGCDTLTDTHHQWRCTCKDTQHYIWHIHPTRAVST